MFEVRRRSLAAWSYTLICARLNVRHSKYELFCAVVSIFVLDAHHTSATTNLNRRLHLVSLVLFFSLVSLLEVKTNQTQWYDSLCLALKVIFSAWLINTRTHKNMIAFATQARSLARSLENRMNRTNSITNRFIREAKKEGGGYLIIQCVYCMWCALINCDARVMYFAISVGDLSVKKTDENDEFQQQRKQLCKIKSIKLCTAHCKCISSTYVIPKICVQNDHDHDHRDIPAKNSENSHSIVFRFKCGRFNRVRSTIKHYWRKLRRKFILGM